MPGWNYAEIWETVATAIPDAPAQIQGSTSYTWREFDERANGVAHALLQGGAQEQDKVAQYLYNCPAYMESMFASWKAGLVPVNTNYRYADDELVYLWDNADAVAVVFHGAFTDTIERILDRVPLKHHQKLHFNWRHFSQWPAILANFDVGLIPLAGEFDARRSTLKPLEYSIMRVPWIASKSPAYAGLEDYGTFVDNTPEAWADALIDAIDNAPNTRKVQHAYDWAREHDIDANVRSMIGKYAQLGQKVTA